MKKNVAGQKTGVQMISASDGSNFTGAVTVYVTGDAGTQAVGSVGAGACTHEGKGYHTYAPAQAETNYDLVALTYEGTGAITTTVQIYTSFPQTIDNLDAAGVRAALGLASANLDTQLVTIDDFLDTEIAAIKAKTDLIPASPSSLDAAGVRTAVGLASANLDTQLTAIDDFLDTEVAAIKAKTDLIPASPASTTNITAATGVTVSAVGTGAIAAASFAAGAIDAAAIATDAIDSDAIAASAVTEIQSGLSTLNAAGVRTAVGLASANLDTQLDALPTAAEIADANWDETRSGHNTAGTFGESHNALVSGSCITGTLTTTQSTTDLTEATDDHYIGRSIVWITGALLGQASAITDYVGSTKTLTYSALTEAPANGDRFVLV